MLNRLERMSEKLNFRMCSERVHDARDVHQKNERNSFILVSRTSLPLSTVFVRASVKLGPSASGSNKPRTFDDSVLRKLSGPQ
jgi:hypothetical protein